jgi:hypothetical protein
MEETDSTSRVTAYELATLASRINPERCIREPKDAIAAAERLLQEAHAAIGRAYQEERRKEWELEEAQIPRENWARALKQITGENRRDRATRRFTEFLEHELPGKAKRQLSLYKRDGFTQEEMGYLQHHFRNWKKQPKRKKGKQGRRISPYDGRLRTDLLGLVPRKPRKPS